MPAARFLHVLIFTLTAQLLSGAPQEWKFGIMGDTHDSPPRTHGLPGVSLGYIHKVNQEFIRHKVEFVVQCGDLADAEDLQDKKGFAVRFEAAEELRKAGIPFYAIRGNHDTGTIRQKQMAQFFIPGEMGTKKPLGFIKNGLDYAFRHKNASLYFMDIDHSLKPDQLVDWSRWMKSYRMNPNRPAHCIVFAHRNLHVPMSFRESLFGPKNDSAAERQDEFYRNLYVSGVDLFASAHLHMHIRGVVKSPNGKYALNSLVAAPCGDKVFTYNIPFTSHDRSQIDYCATNVIGYYIVTVYHDSLKIEFYSVKGDGRKNSPKDETFSLTDSWILPAAPREKSAPEGASLDKSAAR